MLRNRFLCFLLFSICAFQSALSQVGQVQVIPGELPDPSIIEVNGKYYATGSSNDWGPIYPIYESTDLKNWSFVSYVFQKKPDWTISSFWAPELYYKNGTFYCYYTAKRTDGVSMIGVATTQDISKGFQDQGQLLEWGTEAIDAFAYNDNEELYLTWKAYGLDPDKPIQILGAKLGDDGLSVEGESFNILTADSDSWEKGGIEGQSIFRKGDYLYMLYSGNACCGERCDYQVGVARATSMEDDWEKLPDPILVSNEKWKCPGHGTAIKTNSSWYYLYHAYNANGFPYLGRVALLSQLKWNQETKWPYFSENTLETGYKKLGFSDDFDSDSLRSEWVHNIPAYDFQVELKNGKLELFDGSTEGKGSFVGISPQAASFEISTEVVQKNTALKSLALYTTDQNSLGLGYQNEELILWESRGGKWQILNKLKLENTDQLYLRASVQDAHKATFSYSLDHKNWSVIPAKGKDSALNGDHLDWWSWGMKAGLMIQGNSEDSSGQFENFQITYQ